MRRIVCALQDMGCIQNALPVAKLLAEQGHSAAILLNTKVGVAEQRINTGETGLSNLSIIEDLDEQDILLTCLPTWSINELPVSDNIPVVLIPENALVNDNRFQSWTGTPNLTIVGLPMADHDVNVTGLPSVESAGKAIAKLDLTETFAKDTEGLLHEETGIRNTVLSVAMPGDLPACERILTALRTALKRREDLFIFARTHPKLPQEALEYVAKGIKSLNGYNLHKANMHFGPMEQIALARYGLFICDWNSTMALQAAAGGIEVGLVPPNNQDPVQWMNETALLQNGNAIPFLGANPFWKQGGLSPLTAPENATKAIADVALRVACK